MRALFLTQSNSIDFFYELQKNTSIFKEVAYVATNKNNYKSFLKKNPKFEYENKNILKDWTLEFQNEEIDKKNIENIEKKYFNSSSILNSAKIDRRYVGGLKSTFVQNYKTTLSNKELLKTTQLSFKAILKLINDFKPDIIIGFICVTAIEYQAFHIAKKHKIKYLNLRPSRIANRFFVVSDISDPPKEMVHDYLEGLNDFDNKTSEEILNNLKSHFSYEGVVPIKEKDQLKEYLKFSTINSRFIDQKFFLEKILKYFHNIFFKNYLFTIYKWNISKKINSYRSYKYFKKNEIINMPNKYVLFPLHKEPEVQLLLHGAKYQNQFEFIKKVSDNLPDDVQLVVKEHPMGVGYRPVSYYKKISKIKNVILIGPLEDLSSILKNAQFLITIAGTSAFEAMIKKIPVIHFGDLPFELVSNNMINKFNKFEDLRLKYFHLLKSYKYNEEELIKYIGICLKHSTPLDFYSLFLKKSKSNIDENSIIKEKTLQLKLLEKYIINKFNL